MRTSKIILTLLLCLALAPLLAAQGTSQDTGSIRGTVKDKDGVPLPGVAITVTSPSIMGSEAAVTNELGAFRLSLLRVGTYTLTAALQGFQAYKREDIRVGLAATVTLNIEMLPSAINEEVSVTAPSPTVDVKSSTTAKFFQGRPDPERAHRPEPGVDRHPGPGRRELAAASRAGRPPTRSTTSTGSTPTTPTTPRPAPTSTSTSWKKSRS